MNHTPTPIERLESRIAPATLVNPQTVTYFDGDGDLVTIKISKGFFDDPNAVGQADFVFVPASTGIAGRELLQKLDLAADTALDGTNVTFTAVPQAGGGDGTVSIGYIDARGIDLGAVKIPGDLGALDAGDANLNDGGLKSLTVLSLGGEGLDTGAPDLFSDIEGAVGSIRITGDLSEAGIVITGGVKATLGSLYVGGSIVGGTVDNAGQVFVEGALAKATIGGDLLGDIGGASGVIQAAKIGTLTIGGAISGGSGEDSGQVFAIGAITKLTVNGGLIGRDGASSGVISAESIGSLTIDGSIFGGTGPDSGKIQVDANLTSLKITGSLNGGANANTGVILVTGTLGTTTIVGSIFGGDSDATNLLEGSGYIEAGRITTMTIGGSVVAGFDGGGGLLNSGAIRAVNDIGTLTVKGSLEGNSTNPIFITAVGQPTATGATDLAMRSVTILGRVFDAEILAGYSPDVTGSFFGKAVNADAQIGTVRVGGDWIASDLIAGLADGGDAFFGDATDVLIAGVGVKDNAAAVSRISAIIIGGRALGTADAADAFRTGFGAQHVVSMKVGGTTAIPLFAGRGNDTFLPAPSQAYPLGTTLGTFNADGFDVHVYEV